MAPPALHYILATLLTSGFLITWQPYPELVGEEKNARLLGNICGLLCLLAYLCNLTADHGTTESMTTITWF